jgi:hypothetical protein
MEAMMSSVAVRVWLFSLLLLASTSVVLSTFSETDRIKQSDSMQSQARASNRRPSPLSYRSPGTWHKLIIPVEDQQIKERLLSAHRIRNYRSFTLVEVSDDALASLDAHALERVQLRDDLNLLMLRCGQIDTTGPQPQIRAELRQDELMPHSLHIAQMFGPPTPESLKALKATGAKIVSYIPNNAYLVWATPTQLARISQLRRQSDIVQWDGPFHPAYKLHPGILLDSTEQIPVSIQLVDSAEADQAAQQIKAIARSVLMPEFRAAGALHLKVLIESFKLAEVARIPSVMLIEPWVEIRLMDERASQIVAGALSQDTAAGVLVFRPTGPGFLAFLNSLGFKSNFDFAVDIGDTGFDIGSADASKIHPDFLDRAGNARIAYLHDFTSDSHPENPSILPTHDPNGHGTFNASIVGGFNDKTGNQFIDALGFHYGLGVAPFARIGVSKLFGDDGRFKAGDSFAQFIMQAYRGGARITSNSWGACEIENGFCNLYADDSAVLDAFVRDADPETAGNQGIIAVFAAGNSGNARPDSISIPGTAKNVITVGASENFRQVSADGTSSDGCGVSDLEANNALDIVGFSSGGPTQDARSKPDLVAPGSHISGAATQDPAYEASQARDIGLCTRYFPMGQKLYALSSGTSHSTPAVAGAAALAFQWLRNALSREPSPALVKAFLLNSARYLTGRFGGDSLPGTRQGWGLLDLTRAFETTDRIIYDQDPSRTFTRSGGEPFQVTGRISDPSKEFRVMLVWTDPPGNPATNAPYVNQLNLEVIVNGVLYNGNHFDGQYSAPGGSQDFANNVQGVRLPAGTTGSFVIRVRPVIIAGDGVPGNQFDLDQDFALIATNAREEAVPVLTVESSDGISQAVAIQHPNGTSDSFLIPGEAEKITIAVKNQTAVPPRITAAILTLPGGTISTGSIEAAPGSSSQTTLSFQSQIPPNLRCGSVAELQMELTTAFGQVKLPVRVRVGRFLASRVLLEDDVDSGQVVWKMKNFSIASGVASSGSAAYHAVDPGKKEKDNQLSTLLLKKRVNIPADAGHVRLTFFHVFNFEPGYDGGVLEVSTDGGETWQDLGSRAIVGGYDGKVTSNSNNPLGNRLAWTARGRAGVFSQVVIDLDEFAGKQIKLRFLAGFDDATGVLDGYTGWYIDDIRITTDIFTCGP